MSIVRAQRWLAICVLLVCIPGLVILGDAAVAAQPNSTQMPAAEPPCIGAEAGGGNPPAATENLGIQVGVPLAGMGFIETVASFGPYARECDGWALLGKTAERLPWQDWLGDIPAGIVLYSLPSVEYAVETADSWASLVDWFAYEIAYQPDTPRYEQDNPGQASQMAHEFARLHGLGYIATPSRPMTSGHAEEIAQHADAYGVQGYGALRELPEEYIAYVQETSARVRAVNPDILVYVALATDKAGDDPVFMYEVTSRLIGYIDGVFIMMSGEPYSMERLRTLIGLLRGKRTYLPLLVHGLAPASGSESPESIVRRLGPMEYGERQPQRLETHAP